MKKIVNTIKEHGLKFMIRFTIAYTIISCIFIIVAQFFCVSRGTGSSNEPTIKDGGYLIEEKRCYTLETDDLVSAKPRALNGEPIIKRIVAVGGDHVEIKNGCLYINGEKDDWYDDETYRYTTDMDIVVPEGEYFVMGDNRPVSFDSRYFGCITEDEITGKVIWFQSAD